MSIQQTSTQCPTTEQSLFKAIDENQNDEVIAQIVRDNVLDRTPSYNNMPLIVKVATRSDLPNTLYALINKPVNLDSVDDQGSTALHLCSTEKMTTMLIEGQANIEIEDKNQQTPIMVAIKEKNEEKTNALCKANAVPNALKLATCQRDRNLIQELQKWGGHPQLASITLKEDQTQKVGELDKKIHDVLAMLNIDDEPSYDKYANKVAELRQQLDALSENFDVTKSQIKHTNGNSDD